MCENNENTVVPDDADEDIPFPGGPSSEDVSEGDGNRRKTIENVPKTQGIDPEKQHNWWIENLKNIAALGIVAFCLITIGRIRHLAVCVAWQRRCRFPLQGF